jgi:diguanylate cyclase (GGDEF)-like protein
MKKQQAAEAEGVSYKETILEMNKENWDILLERIQYLKNEVRKYKYDFLTGLKMRKDFDGYLRILFEMCDFENRDFTIILIDIDGLHDLNRNSGYSKGDELIKTVADSLIVFKECNGTEIFRIGGDEFGILVKGHDESKLEQALNKLEKCTWAYTHVTPDKDFGSPAHVFKITDDKIIAKKLDKNTSR